MRKGLYKLWLFLFLAGVTGLMAQDLNQQRITIFDSLEDSGPGKGDVIVNQTAAIRNMVGAREYGPNIEKTDNKTYLKVQGYRVQVFSGNSPRLSKDEAFNKEKEVNQHFPDIPTYVTYNAPFWRLRVGDYGSHEEAYYMLRQLTNAFPSFGKEMYIVREEVKLPIHEENGYDYETSYEE
ncbi:MAG: SPOR domain-containing protein [Tannerellaceae bacterium]|nr:SPOR domain-containing protein [Tannerellaceae bacterium]